MQFNGQATLRVRDLESNVIHTLEPEHVLLADGKGARANSEAAPTGDFGIKAHFAAVTGPRDAIELFGCDGLYGGLAAIEGGRWNAAFSVPAQRLRQCRGDMDALFWQIVQENPVLTRRLNGAHRVSRWLSAPLPRFGVSGVWPRGMIPIGNAAAALEPIGGEGISLALRSAELAVQALLAGADERAIQRLRHQYLRLWRVRSPACRAGAIFVSNSKLARASVPLLARFPALARMALELTGK